MAYKQIGDYGVIGDGNTVALIGRDGAVDWMRLPRMNSPSVFGALLDDAQGGRFAIGPGAVYDSAQAYLPHTNVLHTRFRTAAGEIELTDLMVAQEAPSSDPLLLRRVQGIRGTVRCTVECTPRFDYARVIPECEQSGDGLRFRAGSECLVLRTIPGLGVGGAAGREEFELGAGDLVWFALGYGQAPVPDSPAQFLSGAAIFAPMTSPRPVPSWCDLPQPR